MAVMCWPWWLLSAGGPMFLCLPSAGGREPHHTQSKVTCMVLGMGATLVCVKQRAASSHSQTRRHRGRGGLSLPLQRGESLSLCCTSDWGSPELCWGCWWGTSGTAVPGLRALGGPDKRCGIPLLIQGFLMGANRRVQANLRSWERCQARHNTAPGASQRFPG